MNIFAISNDPIEAAKWMVDKHVTKMTVESAQLLSTAHRILDGTETIGTSKSGRKAKRWTLPDQREQILYSATHVNHPCAVWARVSNNNYNWLFCHFLGLLKEYTHRYGKTHKCFTMIDDLARTPRNIPVHYLTPHALAMPDEYKVDSTVESYRNYYKGAKAGMFKWTNRDRPDWI